MIVALAIFVFLLNIDLAVMLGLLWLARQEPVATELSQK
jgi:hypothetical protein